MEMFLLTFFLLLVTRLSSTSTKSEGGILISGGDAPNYLSVELFQPSSGFSCQLPDLPDPTYEHTMDSLTVCGGGTDNSTTPTTCTTLTGGVWVPSYNLVQQRWYHSSWRGEEGLVLLGGSHSEKTSEILLPGGTSVPYFDMKYRTGAACAIPDHTTGTVTITGGVHTSSMVSQYGKYGWVQDLPSMNIPRWSHGCGAYYREDGTRVMLVAGGFDNIFYRPSTELLIGNSDTWIVTAYLPLPLYGNKIVTLDNEVFSAGGTGPDGTRDEVWGWDDSTQEWVFRYRMSRPRFNHAVSVVTTEEDIWTYCV